MNPLFDYSIFTIENPGFEILYEDGPVFVINKPAGVQVQAPIGIDNLASRVKHYFELRDGKGPNQYLGIPHRLDRPTSGALMFARHVRAAQRLSHQFEGRMINKKYWAIVEGEITESTGQWEDFIRKIPDAPIGEVCPPDKKDARWALLNYTNMGRVEMSTPQGVFKGTKLEIELETGRFHQIRIQASSRGCAVWGDALYGSSVPFGPELEDPRARAIALHARYLSFNHPMRDERIEIFAPLPDYWQGDDCNEK